MFQSFRFHWKLITFYTEKRNMVFSFHFFWTYVIASSIYEFHFLLLWTLLTWCCRLTDWRMRCHKSIRSSRYYLVELSSISIVNFPLFSIRCHQNIYPMFFLYQKLPLGPITLIIWLVLAVFFILFHGEDLIICFLIRLVYTTLDIIQNCIIFLF